MRRSVGIVFVLLASGIIGRAQSATLNLSLDLVRLGIAASNLIPNQPRLDAGPLLLAGVEYAKRNGVTRIIAEPGAYYFLSLQFPDRHVVLYQANGITIDFQHSDLFLAHPQKLGLYLQECIGTTVQNFTLDYLSLPFTQVTVATIDTTARRIAFDTIAGWSHPTVFNTRQNSYGLEEPIHVFVFRNGIPVPGLSRLTAVRPITAAAFTLLDEGVPWDRPANLALIKPGDVAVLTPRGAGEPLYVYTGDRVTLRNIQVYSSGINGVSVEQVANALVERVYVMPRPNTDRLISVNADGITLNQPGPNNVVRLSRAVRTLDDGFSPHSLVFGGVMSRLNNRTLRVRRQYGYIIPNGVPVVFQRPTDGALVASAVIVSQNPSPTAPPVFEGLIDVLFDRDLPEMPADTVFYSTDAGHRGAGVLLERNTVQDQVFARGMTLWGLMRATVRGNYIRNADLSGILGPHRLSLIDWRSPPLEEILIERNVIDATVTDLGHGVLEKMAAIQLIAQRSDNFQPMSVSPHRDIRVVNNIVAESSRSAVRLENVTGGSIAGNTIINTNVTPYIDGYWEDTVESYRAEFRMPVVSKTSTGVAASANTVTNDTARVTVTNPAGQPLMAYAPASDILIQGPNVATYSDAILIDADGTRHTLSVRPQSRDRVLVRIASAAALGGAALALSNGATTAWGTLFIDTQDHFALQTTSLDVPQAITIASTANGTALQVTWSAPLVGPPASGYSLVFSEGASVVGSFAVGETPSFTTPVPASAQGSYAVAIRALQGARNGAFSTAFPFTLGNAVTPAAPTNLQVSVGQTFRANWLPPVSGGAPSGYRLDFRSGNVLVSSVVVGQVTTFETAIPPGLSGSFTVTVSALNGSLAGPATTPVPFALNCTPPAAPLVTGSIVNGVATVSWAAVAGATRYIVAAGSAPGTFNFLPGNDVGTQTTVTQGGLPPGFSAWVRVSAANSCAAAFADFLLK